MWYIRCRHAESIEFRRHRGMGANGIVKSVSILFILNLKSILLNVCFVLISFPWHGCVNLQQNAPKQQTWQQTNEQKCNFWFLGFTPCGIVLGHFLLNFKKYVSNERAMSDFYASVGRFNNYNYHTDEFRVLICIFWWTYFDKTIV